MSLAPAVGRAPHMFGASGQHARVVVAAVTDKEWPTAFEVFGACGELVELDCPGVFTAEQYAGDEHLPFVLVRASDRGNTAIIPDIQHWTFQFRPQAYLITGTAGGVWRPENEDRTVWAGADRGEVVFSEFVHYGDYRKVTSHGTFARHNRLEQPSSLLLTHARALASTPARWHRWLGSPWAGSSLPGAREVEILAAGQIQDDPLDATHQWLMKEFDRAGAAEMESAGVAQCLHSLRRDATYAPMYLSVRGISDLIWARDTHGSLDAADVEKAKMFDSERTSANADAGGGDKSTERDQWSPLAASAASAFALGMVERLVRRPVPGIRHPEIPAYDLTPLSVPAPSLVS